VKKILTSIVFAPGTRSEGECAEYPELGTMRAPIRHAACLLATTAIVGLAGLSPAAAQGGPAPRVAGVNAARSFNIPAQPLASALNAFGRQSGLQVTLAAATSRGVTSRAVNGTYTAQQALAQLLAGTGIGFRITGEGTAVVGQAMPVQSEGGGAAEGTEMLDAIAVSTTNIGRGGVSETVITPQDLERLNATDLAGVFREQPGIEVGSSIPMSQKVYVHGIEETNLAVTIDGSRQNNKVFHHSGTNLIDPGVLKAVRVDAGVAPADAGPGALAGSIAYETKDARDFLDADGWGGIGKYSFNFNGDTSIANVTGYARKGGFETLGYFNYGKGDEFEAGNGDIVLGTSTDVVNGIGKISYQAPSGDRFALSYERIQDEAPRPYRANGTKFPLNRPWEPAVADYALDRQNVVFTYTDDTPEGWWNPKAVLAYSSSEIGKPVFLRPPTLPYWTSGKTDSFNGKFENKLALSTGDIVAGVDFYDDTAELDDMYDAATEKATNVGLYAQARLEPWERTRLSFGGRADQQWFTGTDDTEWDNAGLSGNVSGEYDLIADLLTAKAGYSHVWAGIPLAENFVMNPAWDYADGPEPVIADNYIVGLKATYNGFTLEGSVFRSDIDNARVAIYNAAVGAIRARDIVSQGFEIGAGYSWENGFVRVKYADIDVDIDGKPADSETGNYLATPVGQIITVVASHTFTQWGLTIGGNMEIALEMDDVPAPLVDVVYQPIDGYTVVNLYAEYRPVSLPHLMLRLDVNNIFDETYASRGTYGQDIEGVEPLLEPGRSFILTASAKF
jgi:hemoglobin/transferrin/lactoferrin receptor protein